MILFWKRNPTHNFLWIGFSYYSLSIWNEIPCNVRNSPSIQSFKSLYRNSLFKNIWLFVLQLYMFSLLLDLWIYVSVCRFNIYLFILFLMTLTLFAYMHEIWDGCLLLCSYANDFFMRLFTFCVAWRPFEIKTYFVVVRYMPKCYTFVK